jgi:hypothetical protein
VYRAAHAFDARQSANDSGLHELNIERDGYFVTAQNAGASSKLILGETLNYEMGWVET